MANVEVELSGNVTAIQKNVTKQINEVYAELDNDYTEVQDKISELQKDIEQLHNSPIGNLHINILVFVIVFRFLVKCQYLLETGIHRS